MPNNISFEVVLALSEVEVKWEETRKIKIVSLPSTNHLEPERTIRTSQVLSLKYITRWKVST